MQNAGENSESWDEVYCSDDHDGVPSKNSNRDLQKERGSVSKYEAQQQKPKENRSIAASVKMRNRLRVAQFLM